MASRWTQAATILRPTIKVAGRKLLPFCLRHRLALEAIDSPVLSTDRDVGATDIMNAVKILSTHNLEDARKPLTFFELVRYKRMQIDKGALKKEAYKLLIYFNEQSLWPRFWAKKSGIDNSGVDWVLVVVSSLIRNGCTYDQAWTMPESEAIWMHIANMQADGANISVVSEAEWDAMEKDLAEQKTKTNKINRSN
jgi:hypothetical protein